MGLVAAGWSCQSLLTSRILWKNNCLLSKRHAEENVKSRGLGYWPTRLNARARDRLPMIALGNNAHVVKNGTCTALIIWPLKNKLKYLMIPEKKEENILETSDNWNIWTGPNVESSVQFKGVWHMPYWPGSPRSQTNTFLHSIAFLLPLWYVCLRLFDLSKIGPFLQTSNIVVDALWRFLTMYTCGHSNTCPTERSEVIN